MGINQNIGEMYTELDQHAEEIYFPTRIRGGAQKMLNHIQSEMQDYCEKWNLRTVNNIRAVTTLKDREEKVKGVMITIINTGGGVSSNSSAMLCQPQTDFIKLMPVE